MYIYIYIYIYIYCSAPSNGPIRLLASARDREVSPAVIRRREMVGVSVSMVLAEFIRLKTRMMLEPCLLQPFFHVAGSSEPGVAHRGFVRIRQRHGIWNYAGSNIWVTINITGILFIAG